MSAPDISIQNVGKEYRYGAARGASTFWALRDVSLDVARGASVGIIGRNGAGKSTMFKLLAGITAPTTGRIVLNGHVAALIEVGSGFHPELSGRENVFLSGSLLGMKRREIVSKLDRIVEFAGVERFIDTPVKWYSSGMYVRLGFAIAAHLEPHILLVDEVLAVGDAEFQARCLQRIQELKSQGTTNLFISHDLTAIERLCDHAVLLERGEIASTGTPADVVATYHRRIIADANAPGEPMAVALKSGITLTNLALRDPDAPNAVSCRSGGPLIVSLKYEATRRLPTTEFELRIYSTDGTTRVATLRTTDQGDQVAVDVPGGTIECVIPALPLNAAVYYLGALVRDLATGRTLAWWDGETRLHVSDSVRGGGEQQIPHTWRHLQADAGERTLATAVRSSPPG
jgi:ABC-type polysaccharide/polyol phosphate transport system ATPase subunit